MINLNSQITRHILEHKTKSGVYILLPSKGHNGIKLGILKGDKKSQGRNKRGRRKRRKKEENKGKRGKNREKEGKRGNKRGKKGKKREKMGKRGKEGKKGEKRGKKGKKGGKWGKKGVNICKKREIGRKKQGKKMEKGFFCLRGIYSDPP